MPCEFDIALIELIAHTRRLIMYIDPGTAGQVIGQGGGLVLAFLAGMLGVFGLFFKRIVGIFKTNSKVGIAIVAVVIPAIIAIAYWLATH